LRWPEYTVQAKKISVKNLAFSVTISGSDLIEFGEILVSLSYRFGVKSRYRKIGVHKNNSEKYTRKGGKL